MRAASTQRAATSGWTRSVTSSAVPPVQRLALRRIRTLRPSAGTEFAVEPLIGQHAEGDLVELDPAQGGRVAVAPARVGVLGGDELLDGRPAVAHDVRRLAARGGDDARRRRPGRGSRRRGRTSRR